MGNRLEGKVAIVTGAARGQGEATARLFAAEGAAVIMGDVLVDEGEAVAREIGGQAQFVRLDVTDEANWIELVQAALARHGKIDALVNNAAINAFGEVQKMAKAKLERVLAINLVGPYIGIKSVVPSMIERKAGSIVNISSVNGLRGTVGMSAYDASKWGVRGFSKSLALELAQHGIRVNSVHPGAIDTPMLNPDGTLDSAVMAAQYGIAFGRVGKPVEVAHASLFLASDDASYITGAELAVDGAWTAGLRVNSETLDHH
jgi:3alpha(or 20beta)-hydroxysteroid dehydrogenase